MSRYPDQIDNDESLPRVFDSVSETGAEAYNALKEAILAVQRALGSDPQGSVADLVTRISASLNDDGTLKASALLAAGLLALPIDNDQVASNAAIEESKLDLDVATITLQNRIIDNDIDIGALQTAVATLLANFASHITGAAFKHDGYQILLDDGFPSSTPTWLTGITATDVSTAIGVINDRFLAHIATDAVDAHNAENISVDGSQFSTISPSTVLEALIDLEDLREVSLDRHRDDMHANGIDAWENDFDGYNVNNKLFPSVAGTAQAVVISNLILDLGVPAADLLIEQGSVVVIGDSLYQVADIGIRTGFGSKPALTANQVELLTPLTVSTGTLQISVYGASSVSNLKVGLAATIYQGDAIVVDSIQLARPGAAKIVSLGFDPKFITGAGPVLFVDAGVGESLTRSVSISNLHFDRSGSAAAIVDIDTVIERINAVFQNGTIGNAFPAAAYRIGSEIAIVHNWSGDENYWIKIRSTGTGAEEANRFLGFDSDGADILDQQVRPSRIGRFWVGGNQFGDLAQIFSATASVASQMFTFTSNPLAAGVRIGHLLHLLNHSTTTEIGTYLITAVTSSTISVHQPSGILADTVVDIVVDYSGVSLNDLNNSGDDILAEVFVDSQGRTGYSVRLKYPDTIANVVVVDASDSMRDDDTLTVVASSSDRVFTLGTTGTSRTVRSTINGRIRLFGSSNVDWVDIEVTNPIGTGTTAIATETHIDEEDLLEICTVKFNGIQNITHINDKRLFGSTGLDELREDVVQAYVETPTADLRASGTVYGFDIEFIDVAAPSPYPANSRRVFFKGGSAYVGGARVVTNGQYVTLPPAAGTYFVCLDALARYSLILSSEFSLEEILEGLAGTVIPIAEVVRSATNITSAISLTYMIGNVDAKIDFILDLTNHQIGNFATIEAAIKYINSYPTSEKYRLKIVSRTDDDITISGLTRDAVIQIDGYVGELTVSSNCTILADSSAGRTAHITDLVVTSGVTDLNLSGLILANVDVAVGTASAYRIDNCVFDSDTDSVSFTGGTLSYLGLRDCTFASGDGIQFISGFGSGALEMSGCRIFNLSSPMQLGGAQAIITDTVWDGSGFEWNGTGADDALLFSNSVMKNISSSSTSWCVSADNGRVLISEIIFDTITRTTGSMIRLDTARHHAVSNCQFRTLTISGAENPIINFRGDLTNCTFDDITTSHTGALLSTRTFRDSQIITSGQRVVALIADGVIGVGRIEVPTWYSSTIESHVVTGCTLNVTAGVGVGLTPVTASLFSNNTLYAASSTGVTLIQFQDSNATSVAIKDNRFLEVGVGGTIAAIDFASVIAQSHAFGVCGNIFTNIMPFQTNSSGLNSVIISDNHFGFAGDGISGFTLDFGDNCTISGNRGSVMTLGGGTNGLLVSGNAMQYDTAGIIITGSHTNAGITDNYSGLRFEGSLNNSNIANNRGWLIASNTGVFFTEVIVSGNQFGNLDTANYTFGNVGIRDNLITGPTITFVMNGILNIESNMFDSGSVIVSGTVDGLIFRDNVGVVVDTVSLVISVSSQNIVFNNNSYIGLAISGTVTNGLFDSNFSPSATMDFTGADLTAVSISENFVNVLSVATTAASRISITRNVIYDSIYFGTTAAFSYTNCVIANNTVNVDLIVGGVNDGYAFGSKRITNLILSTNVCSRIVMLDSFISGIVSVTNSVISDNICDTFTLATNVNTTYLGDSFVFSDNAMSGNRIGTLTIGGGDLGTALNRLEFSRIVLTNNVIASFRAGGSELTNTVLESQFTTCTISNNSFVTFALFLTASSNIIISGNTFTGSCQIFTNAVDDITVPLSSLVFTGNITSSLNVDFTPTTGIESFAFFPTATYGDIVLSGNRVRAFRFLSGDESSKSLNQVNIADNVFSGAIATESPGVYIEGIGNNFTASFVSFSNNSYIVTADSARLEFNIASVLPTTLEVSNMSFDSNRGIDLIFETNSGGNIIADNVVISGNVFASFTDSAGFKALNVVAVASEVTDLIFLGNMGGIIDLQNFISVSRVFIADNNMRNNFAANSMNFDNAQAMSTITLSGNYTRGCTFANMTNVFNFNVVGNQIGISTSEDFIISGSGTVSKSIITGNTFLGDLSIGSFGNVTMLMLSSNYMDRFTVQTCDILNEANISSNYVSNSLNLSADLLSDAQVVGNKCETLDLQCVEIVRMTCVANNCDNTFVLPDTIGVFTSTGQSMSKIAYCYADRWVCNGGAFTTGGGQTRLFVFGNTSNAASTGPVTFAGAVAFTTANSNEVNGGDITVA